MADLAFTLVLAQLGSDASDKGANMARARDAVAEAGRRGGNAIAFPEMFLTGYAVLDRVRALAEPLDGSSVRELCQLARKHSIAVICGFPEAKDGRIYNSVVVIDSGGHVAGCHRKTHLFRDEIDYFAPGDGLDVIHTSDVRLGIAICYENEFPEAVRMLALKGAEVLVVPTASMEPYEEYQRTLVRARALENGIYAAGINAIGVTGPYRFFGESCAFDPRGRILARAKGEEAMLTAEMTLPMVAEVQAASPYFSRRRPDLYGALTDDRTVAGRPHGPPGVARKIAAD